MKRKRNVIILSIFIVIFCFGYFLYNKIQSNEEIYLEYGSSFSNIKIINAENEKLNFPKSKKMYKVVFYLDSRCKTCKKELEIVNRLSNILEENNIEVRILWQDKINKSLLDEYNIPTNVNYVLDNMYINATTPSIYILDKNNKVIYNTIEVEKVMKKILTLDGVSIEKIKDSTNKLFENEVKKLDSYDNNKEILVYFSLEGCSDCEKANPIIYSSNIQEKYNILKIGSSDSSEEDDNQLIDNGNFYGCWFS